MKAFTLSTIEPCGDYAADCATGRAAGRTWLAKAAADKNPSGLGQVVRSTMDGGRWTGIEVGFLHEVARTATIR